MSHKAVVKAYPQRSFEFHIAEARKLYKQLKNRKDGSAMDDAVDAQLKKLREQSTQTIKQKTDSMLYFVRAAESQPAKRNSEGSPADLATATKVESSTASCEPEIIG